MARTSLLLSIALVLVIASFVSSHPPMPKKTQKNICPPTLSGIQSFPSLDISNFIEQKAKSAPNSIQFSTLFSICKTYSNQLSAFKVAGVKNVYGVVYAKYAMITKAMFAAEAAVGVEGDLSVKLGKSYTGMAGCFVKLEEKIVEMSNKYKFNANAKISQEDRDKVDECLIKLKNAINVFVKVITECSVKFSSVKQIGIPLVHGGRFIGAFAKNGVGFGSSVFGVQGRILKGETERVRTHRSGSYYPDQGKRSSINYGDGPKRETGGAGTHRSGIYPKAEGKVGLTYIDIPENRMVRGDDEFRSRVNPGGLHLIN
ncbi:unnamed protein product [Eruca vesicaria subsp. sativa]|uniref:Uncharacterized protein n=1 Tax=Eruca vesicaria subsp. sativa TaxID=29727 RepID=A0ABC8LMK2_ERUVS|nr:unnamed protein product [Eruca vesicaria subsp. sativa]